MVLPCRRGIIEKTIAAWLAVTEPLGLTAENLADARANALRQFGSVEAACQAKAKERDALAAEAVTHTAANDTLRQEQARIRAALEAVAKAATAAIEAERARTRVFQENVDRRMAATLKRLEALQQEAATLDQELAFARAINQRDLPLRRTVDPAVWIG